MSLLFKEDTAASGIPPPLTKQMQEMVDSFGEDKMLEDHMRSRRQALRDASEILHDGEISPCTGRPDIKN